MLKFGPLRETALRDNSITPAKLHEYPRAFENSAKQASQMEKSLTATEQNLAALNVTQDEANSRQGSRNKFHRTTTIAVTDVVPNYLTIDGHFHIKNNTERRQTENPSAAKCYNCGDSWLIWMPDVQQEENSVKIAIALYTLQSSSARPSSNQVPFVVRENISETSTVE